MVVDVVGELFQPQKGLEKQAEVRTWRALHTRWGPLDFITIDPHDESQAQSVIIIHTFDICKFSYSLKLICNTQINTCSAFSVTHRHVQQQIFLYTFPVR